MIPQSWSKLIKWAQSRTPKSTGYAVAYRFLKELESVGRKGRTKDVRQKCVKKSYEALREAWILEHGNPRVPGPRSMKIKLRFVKLLTASLREGSKPLKQFAHRTRERALTKQTNEKAARKSFLSSTVSRAIAWPVTSSKLQSSVEEAKARWFQKKRVDERLYRKISQYIDQLPLKPFAEGELPPWPLPNNHACLSHSVKEGGTGTAIQEAATRARLERLDFLFTGIQTPNWVEAVTGVFPADRVEDLFQDFEDVCDSKEPDYVDIVKEYINGPFRPETKPLPIAEMGGKVRVVTLHPAEEVTVARRLTQLWLTRLSRCVVSRAMLKNEPVEMSDRGEANAQVYSADLSAATDHIDHGLATFVAEKICEKLNRPHDVAIVRRLFGPKKVHGTKGPTGDYEESTCGIHMGLGPTWVILSILNGFAAWNAGALKETYRVCGDDLTGIWSRSRVKRYEATLEALGLVNNKSKAFLGKRGVFCERLISRKSEHLWAADDVGHLAEITAAKVRAKFSENALAVADHLRDVNISRRVVDRVRRGLIPRTRAPGRVRHGGNGFGEATIGTLLRVVQRKPQLTVTTNDSRPVTQMAVDVRRPGDISLQDALVTYQSAVQLRRVLDNKVTSTRPLTKKEFRRLSKASFRKVTVDQLRQAVRDSSLRKKDRQTALFLMRSADSSAKTLPRKVLRRVANVVERPPKERFVSMDDLGRVIQKNTNLAFEERLRKRYAKPPQQSPTATIPTVSTVVRPQAL